MNITSSEIQYMERRPKRKRSESGSSEDLKKIRLNYSVLSQKRQCPEEDQQNTASKRQTIREYPTEQLMAASNRINELERLVRVTKHIISQQQLRLNELEYELKITRENVSCIQLNHHNYVY